VLQDWTEAEPTSVALRQVACSTRKKTASAKA
jgi:hypothetical protein